MSTLSAPIHVQGFKPETRVLAQLSWNPSVGAYDISYVTPMNQTGTYRIYSSDLIHFPTPHRPLVRSRFERVIAASLGYLVDWL